MEVKEKSKKRELIKTIAIIFLIILLLLTFFSQTIMNRSLPEVSTKLISSGNISAKIRGSGTVSANESYNVILNETRTVQSVYVKVGDTVEVGDLLFVLEDIESAELKAAQDTLYDLNKTYQEHLLNLSKTQATEDRTLTKLREDLEKANKERDDNAVTEEEIATAKRVLAETEDQLRQIANTLKALENSQKTTGLEEAKAKVTELEGTVKSLQGEIETLQSDIQGYYQELNNPGSSGSTGSPSGVTAASEALQDAKREQQSNWLAYEGSYTDLLDAVAKYYVYNQVDSFVKEETDASDPTKKNKVENKNYTDGFRKAAVTPTTEQRKYLDAFFLNNKPTEKAPASIIIGKDGDGKDITTPITFEYLTAYQALIAAQEKVDTAQAALNKAQADQNSANNTAAQAQNQIYAKISKAQNELYQAQSKLSAASSQLAQAKTAYQQAESTGSALTRQIDIYKATQDQLTATKGEQEKAITELDEKKKAYDAALEAVAAAERALEDAVSGKDIDQQLEDLALKDMRRDIEQQRELVEKLTKDTVATEITSKVSGTVSAINVSSGKENTPGSPMAVIDVSDRGYILKFPVTREQAKYLKVGDKADVTNYYWGSDVDATLEAIAADPGGGGQSRQLVFRVSGDIEPGANITLSIGQKSTTYDTVVPKSALREDTNGHFVLVITAKNTPLGNRFIATRVDVQVLAEDDTTAAVSGLTANDYVITTSSQPLTAGTQVRMVEGA